VREHGGNIYEQSRINGFSPDRVIDFSASINPNGMPRRASAAIRDHIRLVPHYPETHSESLASVIEKHYRIKSGSVICGNGSTELIYLIPRVLKPRRVLVTAPAFSEYEKACEISGKADVARYVLGPEDDFSVDPDHFINAMEGLCSGKKEMRCDLAFLCNPNNPTGRLMKKRDILKIADAAFTIRCYLVVDEAFIDFCEGESVIASVAKNPYLIVLRSMTKFYALAGLRLGFGVFHPRLAGKLKRHKEPWSVNSLALAAGSVVFSDRAYQNASLAMFRREKRFLENKFNDLGIKYFASDANYYLLHFRNSRTIVNGLEKKGILVRDCSNFKGLGKGYVRIAVRSRKENSRLMKELAQLCQAS
jgi:threonine-phosphate decarboxylase